MEKRHGSRGRLNGRHISLTVGLCMMFLAGVLLTADKGLTKDEVKPGVSMNVQREQNTGCFEMETNPLREISDADMEQTITRYYEELADKAEFVETYHNLKGYEKQGKYRETCVVFVRYDMKIKGIYTEVPGLETLYLEKDEEGSWQAVSEKDQEIKEYVEKIAEHEDVRQLMEDVQIAYANAVAEDAILEEALRDLQNAYAR